MNTKLMEAFHFDEEDLAANRAGTLSRKQAQQVKKGEAWATGVTLVLALAASVGAVLLLLPYIQSGQLPQGGEIARLVFGGLLVLVAIWLWRGALFSKTDMSVAKAQGPMKLVKSVHRSGDVSDAESSRTNVVAHQMVVGGHTFGVTPQVFNDVLFDQEGATYAVYFTKKPENLLSLERIASAQD